MEKNSFNFFLYPFFRIRQGSDISLLCHHVDVIMISLLSDGSFKTKRQLISAFSNINTAPLRREQRRKNKRE